MWSLASRLAVVFCKSFLPLTIIKKPRAVFKDIPRIKKKRRENFPTTAHKKEVRYSSNSLFVLIKFFDLF